MAYENITYELILNRMIERVKNENPDLDTREGSIIFNALAPAAIELAIAYTELDNLNDETFVGTASREYVYRKCEEIGIDVSRFEASYGYHEAIFDVEVEIGSRWNCDLHNYVVVEDITAPYDSLYHYKVQCETVGREPNSITGALTPISSYVDNLSVAHLNRCLTEGEDEASPEEIRQIYFAQVAHDASDGNIGQYQVWCDMYDGVGNYKIVPQWNGPNTVKVYILSTSNDIATQALVNDFQNYIDPGCTGMGDGVAPIGAFVTVGTATYKPISISAEIELEEGYSDTTIVIESIEKYFRSISFKSSKVAYINVGAAILNTPGVKSINNLLVNNGTQNIDLLDNEIPQLYEVNGELIVNE